MVDLYAAPFVDMIDRMRLEFAQPGGDLRPAGAAVVAARGGRQRARSLGAVPRSRRRHAGRPRLRAAVADGSEPGPLLARRLADHGAQDGPDQRRARRSAGPASTRPTSATTSSGRRSSRSHDSLDQYVQGAMLIHMLRHAPRSLRPAVWRRRLHRHRGRRRSTTCRSATTWPASTRDKVRRFIDGMIDATRERRAAAQSNSAPARRAPRSRLPDAAEPQHHALDVPRLPGRRDRADLRVPAHGDGRPHDRQDEPADARQRAARTPAATTCWATPSSS